MYIMNPRYKDREENMDLLGNPELPVSWDGSSDDDGPLGWEGGH
jgi:hypothetical protein